ncbi:MAG TPA: pyridoxamine 5'-phosphate oxidase family protein [Burkholderiales bacterium]|nr:pyridoxamine 5'-phosphate oxidase family protein [Burkholderiales bacterium]
MQGSRGSQEGYAKLHELVDEIKVAMMTTVDDGIMRSRPLQTLRFDADGALWFFTSQSSPKVTEAQGEGWQVNLSYAHPGKHHYVSISGRAELTRDREQMERLWTKWVEVWFPKGLDDPDLALLRVHMERAEYWDAPGSAMGRLYALTKALSTGDKSALGENEKLGG